MPTTPNGFTVLDPGSPQLVTLDVHGRPFVVWKPAQRAVRHLVTFLHAVEPVTEAGWDGGHAKRPPRGSSTGWSEHAAGTALDWNASQHPRGAARDAGWTDDQVRVIRWYLQTTIGRLWRWGNDFRTTPDPMHFELRSKQLWDDTPGWWKP